MFYSDNGDTSETSRYIKGYESHVKSYSCIQRALKETGSRISWLLYRVCVLVFVLIGSLKETTASLGRNIIVSAGVVVVVVVAVVVLQLLQGLLQGFLKNFVEYVDAKHLASILFLYLYLFLFFSSLNSNLYSSCSKVFGNIKLFFFFFFFNLTDF